MASLNQQSRVWRPNRPVLTNNSKQGREELWSSLMADDEPTPPESLPMDVREVIEAATPEELDAIATYADALAEQRAADRRRGSAGCEGRTEPTTGTDEDASRAGQEATVKARPTDRPDGVPSKASTTVKEINGNRYYYWQWRDGDRVRSQYKGPVESERDSE